MSSSELTERTKLITSNGYVSSRSIGYDSVVITTDSTNDIPQIFCTHGKDPKYCCQTQDNDDQPFSSSVRSSTHRITLSHCHTKMGDMGIDKTARKKLIFVSLLCLVFMIAEVIGGYLANSLAIATDAAHLLTDFVGFMISLFALWIGSRPPTKRMSFGWYRAEVVGALISVLTIWVVTAVIFYMAVQRVIKRSFEIEAGIMLITASVGIVVNILMAVVLQMGGVPHGHSHGGGHGHGHGNDHSHSNGHSIHESHGSHDESAHHNDHHRGNKNLNIRAAYIHVLGDFVLSLGVLIAAIIIYFKPNWAIVDPICTFLFSVLVLFTTYNIIKDALNVLMEGLPRGIDFLEVQRTLFEINGVIKVHNLRIWSLSMDKTALAAHIAIGKNVNPTAVLTAASNAIKRRFNIFELTIQVEEYREEMNDCIRCQDPV